MFSNRLAFAALAVTCIVAAGAGGYLATRQNATPVPIAAAPSEAASAQLSGAVPSTAAQADATAAPAKPVQETEGIVGDAPSAPPSPPVRHTDAATGVNGRSAKATASEYGRPQTTRQNTSAATVAPRQIPGTASRQLPPVQNPPATDTPASVPPAGRPNDRVLAEPPRAPDPPARVMEELVVPANSVLGLQTENTISSEHARVEDRVDARVTRDVRVGDKVAIPAGTRAIGSVTQVERGGKIKDRAHLSVRFHTLVLADGTRVPINTDVISRDGDAPTSAQKIGGGAVAGTILGAIFGGAKGAAIGGAAGAGAGAAVTEAGDRKPATLPAGTAVTARIQAPITVAVEQQ